MNGRVTNIQRYSVNDGYGIRTIVFLAGCSMRCAWCQNPETMRAGEPVVMFTGDSCGGCGACLPACPNGAIRQNGKGLVFDRSLCTSCFACVDVCYFGARKTSAKEMTPDEAFAEVMKDAAFYRRSGGGLTLSGGEPLLQPAFCRELLRRTKEAGFHTAMETAGNVSRQSLAAVVPHTDLFLYDVKLLDEAKHRKATGVSNKAVIANLEFLVETGIETIVRIPLIPDVNDGEEFDRIADFVASHPGLGELHILPYHTLGVSKYEQLGQSYVAAATREENDAEVERCLAYAGARGLRVSVGGAGFAKQRK